MSNQRVKEIQSEISVLVGIVTNLSNTGYPVLIKVPNNVNPVFERELTEINDQCSVRAIEILGETIRVKRIEVLTILRQLANS
jgi:hypothetical protein